MAAKIVQDARSAKFIGSCRAAARPKGGACAGNPRYNKSDTAYILNLFNFRTDTRTTPLRRGSRSRNHRIGTAGTGAVEPGRPRRVPGTHVRRRSLFRPGSRTQNHRQKSPRRVLRHGQGQSQDRHVPDDRPRRAVVAGRCRPGIRLRGPQGRAGVQDALHGSLHGRNVRRLGDRTYALVFRPAGRLRRCGVPDIRRAGVWNANCTARGMEKESVNGSHNAGTWIGPYCTCACSREA